MMTNADMLSLCLCVSIFRCCMRCFLLSDRWCRQTLTLEVGVEVGERPPRGKGTSLIWDRLQVWATGLIQPATGTLADWSCPGGASWRYQAVCCVRGYTSREGVTEDALFFAPEMASWCLHVAGTGTLVQDWVHVDTVFITVSRVG